MTPALTATLARLRELEKKASDKPWSNIPGEQGLGIFDNRYCLVAESMSRIDLNLIIQSRNALPELLDEIEKLESQNEYLKARHEEVLLRYRCKEREFITEREAECLAKIERRDKALEIALEALTLKPRKWDWDEAEYDPKEPWCAECGESVAVASDLEFDQGDMCWPCTSEKYTELVKKLTEALDQIKEILKEGK